MEIDPAISTYPWFSAGNMLWEEMEKPACIQLPCYQGREASGFWDIKTASRDREEKMVCAWMNWMCHPQNLHKQEVALSAALCRAPLSRSLWAAELILMNHRQCHKSIFFRIPPVPVTRLKQRRRKEQPWVLSIFKWGFRGIANIIQENKTKLRTKPNLNVPQSSFSLACCVLAETHTLQVRNFRKKELILFLWSQVNSIVDPWSTLLHLTMFI